MRILWLVALLGATGCGRKETICQAARECIDTYGGPGLCLQMRCAFQDNQCASGYRFDDSAGDLADTCVDQAALPDAGVPDARPDAR